MERATHILVECPELIASVRVGVLDALAPLEGSVCEVRFRETRRIERQDIQWCDILVCVRGSETLTQQVVSETKRHGRLVFYFLDDDLLHLPEDSLSRAYFDDGDHQKALRDILGQSDGLWGVNEEIRTLYLPLCGTQRWICSRVPARVRPRRAGAGEGAVCRVHGSPEHGPGDLGPGGPGAHREVRRPCAIHVHRTRPEDPRQLTGTSQRVL